VKLKQRVLIQTLSVSLTFIGIFSLLVFAVLAGIRNRALLDLTEIGDQTALISSDTLEDQVSSSIMRIASDWAIILNEKLIKIENHTRMTADIASSIYTRRGIYLPHPLPRVMPGEIPPSGPYLYIPPGTRNPGVYAEAELAGNIGPVLQQILVVDRGITTSTIGGEAGYVIAVDSFPWPLTDFDPRQNEWYQSAKGQEGLIWTGVYVDSRGRGPVISCAVPFYERRGERRIFRGVARSAMLLSDFSRLIDSAGVGRSGYIFLLDHEGTKVFSSGNSAVRVEKDGSISGDNYLKGSGRLLSLGQSMVLGASGMTELHIGGIAMYAAYAPVETLGWSLGVAISAEEIGIPGQIIREQIYDLTEKSRTGLNSHILIFAVIAIIMLILSICGVVFLSVRFTSTITSPILALNDGVQEVSGGNLNREVRITTEDELEQLARSFNAMTGKLRDHITQIENVTAEKERIATELDVAARIQASILPVDFPPFPGRGNELDLYAATYPAKEVGGDFYDFFFIDNDHFVVLVADVSGKGVPAALFMAITKTLIKNHLQMKESPESAMANINRQLCDNNTASMFVTVWLGILEISSGRLEYINAGHNPPLRCQNGESFTFLPSPPDLVLAGMEDTVYHKRETVLEKNDTLFLYSDGITEAENTEGEFYGKERLKDFLDKNAAVPLRKFLAGLRSDIETFSKGAEQSDDITMLAIRAAQAPSAAETLEQLFPQEDRQSLPEAAVHITLPADDRQLERLIEFIAEKLKKAGCPQKILGQIELAVEEIFINIARYGYKNQPPSLETAAGTLPYGTVELCISCVNSQAAQETTATLIFTDRGKPFNPLEHDDPHIDVPLEDRPQGGLGILITRRIMDIINYNHEAGTNRLIMTKTWRSFPEENV
jgi:sigma-B regulation protein RsbU (phosphoserine phosphatase)